MALPKQAKQVVLARRLKMYTLLLTLFAICIHSFGPNIRNATVLQPAVVYKDDDIPCLDYPRTLAIGIGGKDCTSRLTSLVRLRMMLLSLEQANEDEARISINRTPISRLIHILLWLNSDDETTLPLAEEIISNLKHVASVRAIDIGNSTALTGENSPPITGAFKFRPYDWVKFWGMHYPDNPSRYVLNVDVDTIFLRPLSEVWIDGCQKLLDGPSEAFYVAGEELLGKKSYHPGFTHYINSGVAFLDLQRREAAYNRTTLTNDIITHVHKNKTLLTKGTWPPEQWLWNAIFEHYPQYLALFSNSTQCNCATHKTFPGADDCKLAHYCNTNAAHSIFNATEDRLLPFSSSLGEYIRQSLPRLHRRVTSVEKELECPVSS